MMAIPGRKETHMKRNPGEGFWTASKRVMASRVDLNHYATRCRTPAAKSLDA